jgi:hypothetical protein
VVSTSGVFASHRSSSALMHVPEKNMHVGVLDTSCMVLEGHHGLCSGNLAQSVCWWKHGGEGNV